MTGLFYKISQIKKTLICVYLFTQSSFLFSQNLKMESCFRFGTLIAHREDMIHLPIERSYSVELNYYFKKKSEPNLKKLTGISLMYENLGNKEVLGEVIGVSGFYKLPIYTSEKQEFNFRLGAGLSYVSKVFNLENNQKNTAISSHLNAMIDFSFNHALLLYDKYSFYYGLAFMHLSNGASSVPNLGLNYPLIKIGLGLNSMDTKEINEKSLYNRRRNLLALMGGGFCKQILDNYGVKYPVYYGSFFYQIGLKRNLSVEFGMDGMYNTSLNYLFYSKKNKIVSDIEPFQMGLYLGGNAHLNKLHCLVGMGAYTLDNYKLNGLFYHKLILRYQPLANILFGIGVKSHWLNADYLEVSGGYTF